MNAIFRSFAAVCVLILMPLQGAADQRVTVFAAASLKDVLDGAVQHWPIPVVISYGGSGVLARQVAQGAPADVVILANSDWMDWLEEQGRPALGNRRDVISNRLVLVAPADAAPLPDAQVSTLLSRLEGGRIAMGQTMGVPAGIYGRQWLENSGLWDTLRPHLAETENVRAALALVARNEAPLGVVYNSDALAEPRVDVIYTVPKAAHDPIVYPMAVIEGDNSAQAIEFANFLSSETGQALFLDHGFAAIEGGQ